MYGWLGNIIRLPCPSESLISVRVHGKYPSHTHNQKCTIFFVCLWCFAVCCGHSKMICVHFDDAACWWHAIFKYLPISLYIYYVYVSCAWTWHDLEQFSTGFSFFLLALLSHSLMISTRPTDGIVLLYYRQYIYILPVKTYSSSWAFVSISLPHLSHLPIGTMFACRSCTDEKSSIKIHFSMKTRICSIFNC